MGMLNEIPLQSSEDPVGDIASVIDIMKGPIEVNPNVRVQFKEGVVSFQGDSPWVLSKAVEHLMQTYKPGDYDPRFQHNFRELPAFEIYPESIKEGLRLMADLPFEVIMIGVGAEGHFSGKILLIAGLKHTIPNIHHVARVSHKEREVDSKDIFLSFHIHNHPPRVVTNEDVLREDYPSLNDLFMFHTELNAVVSPRGVVQYRNGALIERYMQDVGDFREIVERSLNNLGFTMLRQIPSNDRELISLTPKDELRVRLPVLQSIDAIVAVYPFDSNDLMPFSP